MLEMTAYQAKLFIVLFVIGALIITITITALNAPNHQERRHNEYITACVDALELTEKACEWKWKYEEN